MSNLQYYIHDETDTFRFQLVGDLTQTSAQDLQHAWQTATSVIGDRLVTVDLSRVSSIDPSGEALLKIWAANGVELLADTRRTRERLAAMTNQTIALAANRRPQRCPRLLSRIPGLVAMFFVTLFPVYAATLQMETAKGWDLYVQALQVRVVSHSGQNGPFLWVDQQPTRAAKVRAGEIAVSQALPNTPHAVPAGLIHDWVGAAFLPNTTIDQVLNVVRDYDRYKHIYQPAVLDSKTLSVGEQEDRFSALLANRVMFKRTALETDYRLSQVRLDDHRWYSVSQSTRIQEIADYGASSEHKLPPDEGTGLIWRLLTVMRLEQRDGGVYLEIEAVALSREIPQALRWVADPIVRRVARTSLATSLQQTRDAVRQSSQPLTSQLLRESAK